MLRSHQNRIILASLILSCVAVLTPAFSQERRFDRVSLNGFVRDSHKQPIASATILLESPVLSNEPAKAVSDSSGRFSFAALDPMAYDHVSVQAKGYIPTRFDCHLEPGRANEITITLAPEENARSSDDKADLTFYDEPRFTVSGVTDTTSLGGHGSDTVVHTGESLAKETASLTAGTKPVLPLKGEALQVERDRAQALVTKDPGNAEPHHMLADADEKLGNSLAAVREYQRAAELVPREPYLFDWGSELLLHHAPEPALEVFTKGNQLFPKSERMLLGLGAAWFALGSLDAAFEKFRAASNLDPNDTNPYVFIGKMEKTEKVPSAAAVEMLHRFATRFPDSAEASYYYATMLWRSHKAQHDAALEAEVERLLRKATQADARFIPAYVEIGIVHADQHEYDKAIAEYQQAIQIASGLDKPSRDSRLDALAEAHFRLAGAYRQTGDSKVAAQHFKIWEHLSEESARQTERERHEIPQFVYTLRDQPSSRIR